jgi:hypothetical protein
MTSRYPGLGLTKVVRPTHFLGLLLLRCRQAWRLSSCRQEENTDSALAVDLSVKFGRTFFSRLTKAGTCAGVGLSTHRHVGEAFLTPYARSGPLRWKPGFPLLTHNKQLRRLDPRSLQHILQSISPWRLVSHVHLFRKVRSNRRIAYLATHANSELLLACREARSTMGQALWVRNIGSSQAEMRRMGDWQ